MRVRINATGGLYGHTSRQLLSNNYVNCRLVLSKLCIEKDKSFYDLEMDASNSMIEHSGGFHNA